jgi:hypothetical protein
MPPVHGNGADLSRARPAHPARPSRCFFIASAAWRRLIPPVVRQARRGRGNSSFHRKRVCRHGQTELPGPRPQVHRNRHVTPQRPESPETWVSTRAPRPWRRPKPGIPIWSHRNSVPAPFRPCTAPKPALASDNRTPHPAALNWLTLNSPRKWVPHPKRALCV